MTDSEHAAWRAIPHFEDDFPTRPDKTMAQRFRDGLSKLNEEHVMPADAINPQHYQGFSNGAEVIDITENLNFNRGNMVKYAARAGEKVLPGQTPKEALLQDLEKVVWYAEREIERIIRGDGK